MGPAGEQEDRECELRPPTPERVAERAIVLSAVACRGAIEQDAAEPEAEDLRQRVWHWLGEIGAKGELEEAEHRILAMPLGALAERKRVDASWQSEGMVVLGWALGRLDLPAYDQQCEPSDSANKLGFLDDRAATALANPRLRSAAEIGHWANLYLTLHWRLRQFSLRQEAIDFRRFVETCEWGPLTLEGVRLRDGDLEIAGDRLDRVPETTFRESLSIAAERHRAFNWLRGEEPIYSEVTADT